MRLLPILLPLSSLPSNTWYIGVSIPLMIGTWLFLRQARMPRVALGLRFGSPVVQLMLAGLGLPLGVFEYLVLRPPASVAFGWSTVVVTAISLTLFTGFLEELIFRGILQAVILPVLGRWAMVYVSLLFAALHIGYQSAAEVVFVFMTGLLFAYIVYWSRSIFGVTLAHSFTNLTLFVIMPFLVQEPSRRYSSFFVEGIWAMWVLTSVAISILIWQAGRDRRLVPPHLQIRPGG